MDSSIDHTTDSDVDTENDGDDPIPMAVPVAAIVATNRSHDEMESEEEVDDDETGSLATENTPLPNSPPSKKRSNSEISDPTPSKMTESGKKKKYNSGKPRQPAAKGLTIPFRTIKRIMKIDSAIGIIQNDAAIVATAALEHFVKEFAVKSLELAKSKGRNTIKYDDVAEVRANDRSLSFLDLLLP
eukprot:CAMPEP_0172312562 /NCGR_PEP_ID=MMETSP1058-20130122/17957_1 /TAXON_ID=83371 /ORGANISM="Detonula confervacea, Strain CCMP 353" /LENGTH=185 /DNA_ID=CAMNT_0013026061 /DNA_START=101 /DNA_END=658 /DNA_ORIENTATION=+